MFIIMFSISTLLQAAEYLERRDREAEHGYASTAPMPDYMTKKKIKPKKSQGNRSTHNELEKNRRAHLRHCLEKLKDIVPVGSESSRHTTLGSSASESDEIDILGYNSGHSDDDHSSIESVNSDGCTVESRRLIISPYDQPDPTRQHTNNVGQGGVVHVIILVYECLCTVCQEKLYVRSVLFLVCRINRTMIFLNSKDRILVLCCCYWLLLLLLPLLLLLLYSSSSSISSKCDLAVHQCDESCATCIIAYIRGKKSIIQYSAIRSYKYEKHSSVLTCYLNQVIKNFIDKRMIMICDCQFMDISVLVVCNPKTSDEEIQLELEVKKLYFKSGILIGNGELRFLTSSNLIRKMISNRLKRHLARIHILLTTEIAKCSSQWLIANFLFKKKIQNLSILSKHDTCQPVFNLWCNQKKIVLMFLISSELHCNLCYNIYGRQQVSFLENVDYVLVSRTYHCKYCFIEFIPNNCN
ncbi:hypothetical protein KUTeg_005164 [Tegillarca granosa]|uniref:BHLH domain-containing protein n=1 Tax=Tegillarca granosa TaxID=220873 RepID=A0ABQ9FLV5_TEGGR|nr:hypothetical protein KUTeg_005164 [Tegillarca granosa]